MANGDDFFRLNHLNFNRSLTAVHRILINFVEIH